MRPTPTTPHRTGRPSKRSAGASTTTGLMRGVIWVMVAHIGPAAPAWACRATPHGCRRRAALLRRGLGEGRDEVFLLLEAHELLHDLPALEDNDGGDGGDAVLHRHGLVGVHIHLADLGLAGEL